MGLINFNLGDVGELFKDVREAITGKAIDDPVKKAEIELKLSQLEQSLKMGQLEINKMEAQSTNWFIAGWRPFVGWTSGFAVAYYYVISPFLHSLFAMIGYNFPLPTLDIGALYNLLLVLLGVAGLRTYEKLKKVNNIHN